MCCAVAGVYLKVYFLGGQTAENEDEAISICHSLQLVFLSWVGEPEHKYAILPIFAPMQLAARIHTHNLAEQTISKIVVTVRYLIVLARKPSIRG